jgi:hypothetical protein
MIDQEARVFDQGQNTEHKERDLCTATAELA